jgi:hypothetical protein
MLTEAWLKLQGRSLFHPPASLLICGGPSPARVEVSKGNNPVSDKPSAAVHDLGSKPVAFAGHSSVWDEYERRIQATLLDTGTSSPHRIVLGNQKCLKSIGA